MALSDLYTDSFFVKRETQTKSSGGGVNKTWATALTSNGRIEPLSGTERILNDRNEIQTTHRLYCPVIDIRATDKIELDSKEYKVFLVESFDKGLEPHMEVMLELIQ